MRWKWFAGSRHSSDPVGRFRERPTCEPAQQQSPVVNVPIPAFGRVCAPTMSEPERRVRSNSREATWRRSR